MDELRHYSHQDRAIESETADKLDRGPFVDSLVRALVKDNISDSGQLIGRRSTGYVVGLTGRWGLGKSSILNLVYQKLDTSDHVVVANFNPWLFNGRDELVSAFFTVLRNAMGRGGTKKAEAMAKAIDQYWGAINLAGHGVAAVVDVYGGSGAATSSWKSWAPKFHKAVPKSKLKTPDEERLGLELKIAEANCAVVVLIDELDRIEDDEVRAVAQLIKAVGDIKGLSYLAAYDPDRVIEALGRGSEDGRRQTGERYIEKIIQHAIPLRPLFNEDVSSLFEAALADHGLNLKETESDREKKLFNHLIDLIDTPRDVKRLVGTYAILERAVRGEICPFDVLGYCWILIKSPGLREKIASHIDDLVIDPSSQALKDRMMRNVRNMPEPDFNTILGNSAAAHIKTLELLFPHLTDQTTDPNIGQRISKRRNLVRMLYLGNPPGMIRRSVLENLWVNSDLSDLENTFRQLMIEDKLASSIDRLDDLLFSLPESGDQTFWVALSRSLLRSSKVIEGPDAKRALLDDAATSLLRIGQRNPEQRHRLQTAIDALIADSDLLFVPWLLRKHLFAHGSTRHTDIPRGGEVLTLEETKALLSKELPRYRHAVLDGTFLQRLPDTEVIYVLTNTQNWDKELRDSLTEQIDSMEVAATLAALLVPPGISTNSSVLTELFDSEIIQARLEKWIEKHGLPHNQWLSECLQRLRKLLAGNSLEGEDD